MTDTHSESGTLRELGAFALGLAAAILFGYGLLQLLGPVYYWGGNACAGAKGMAAYCGVMPLGFMLSVLPIAFLLSWLYTRRPL